MRTYITEESLREHFGLGHGTEIELDYHSILTPAARELINSRKIQVKYKDEQGRLYIEDDSGNKVDKVINKSNGNENTDEPKLKHVHGLTSDDQYHAAQCVLCHQELHKKPDTLTHLNGDSMISKNDPRIKFRGEVDSAIALAIWIQTELEGEWSETLLHWLGDIRSNLGNIMKAEVTGHEMAEVSMGDLTSQAIHKMSHNPLKYIGYDHIVPEVKHGKIVAKLNILRTKIREVESSAAQLYITRNFNVERPDIMQGLNRLSSAIYVLMIMTIVLNKNGSMPEVKYE